MHADHLARIRRLVGLALGASVHVAFLELEFLVRFLDRECTGGNRADHVVVHYGLRSVCAGLKTTSTIAMLL